MIRFITSPKVERRTIVAGFLQDSTQVILAARQSRQDFVPTERSHVEKRKLNGSGHVNINGVPEFAVTREGSLFFHFSLYV